MFAFEQEKLFEDIEFLPHRYKNKIDREIIKQHYT